MTLSADDVRGVVVHTDLRRTGWFTCSDERLQPAARGRGVELPRQRLRHPHRLPAPRAGRLDRRLAAVRADRRLPLRRRRVLARSGCATSPPTSGRTARSRTSARPRGPRAARGRSPSSTARPGGATPRVIVPWEIYRAYGDARVLAEHCGRRWSAGSTGPSGWPAEPATPTGRSASGAGAARAVPLGHRLPLGRVAGAREDSPARPRRVRRAPTRATWPPPSSRTAPG